MYTRIIDEYDNVASRFQNLYCVGKVYYKNKYKHLFLARKKHTLKMKLKVKREK